MQRYNKPKKKTKQPVTITQAQKNRMVEDITNRTVILFIATAMDEFDWTEEQVEDFAIRLQRYADAVDDHIISLKKVSEIVERVTGMVIRLE